MGGIAGERNAGLTVEPLERVGIAVMPGRGRSSESTGRRALRCLLAAALPAAALLLVLAGAPVSVSGIVDASAAVRAGASGSPFTDVAPGAKYAAAITDLAAAGVVAGYGDGSFRPGASLTRQQFAKVIVEALDLEVSEADVVAFTDVEIGGADSLYPDNYVAAAAREGLVLGTGGGRFTPYARLSRAQLVTMLVRTSGHPPARLALPAVPGDFVGSLGIFDPTHGPAARKAEYAGLLHGLAQLDQHWDPWAPATRGEAAQLLWNLLWLRGRQSDAVDRSRLVPAGGRPLLGVPVLALSDDAVAWIRLKLDGEGFPEPESVRALSLSGGSDATSEAVSGPVPFWPALALDGTTVAWDVSFGGDAPTITIWVNDTTGGFGRFLEGEPVLRFMPALAGGTAYWGELRPAEDGSLDDQRAWLMAQDIEGGAPREVGRSTLPYAGALASGSYVLWVAGEGEGDSSYAYSLYDVGAGRIVSEWETDRGRDGHVDHVTDVDGDFALFERTVVERGADSLWWRRSWLVLRHLPTGRETALDTPGASSFWAGPSRPSDTLRAAALEQTGLDGDSVWGVSTVWVRQVPDQPYPDTHWSLWVRDISAEKALLAGDAPLPEETVTPADTPPAAAAPPLVELAFGGPGSELLDAELVGGRPAWAAREGTEQVVYLRSVAVPGSLGEPDTPARMGGLR
ncbi:MAG: S-layer homology domain-containing protein [Thermoleophilia bacterium]